MTIERIIEGIAQRAIGPYAKEVSMVATLLRELVAAREVCELEHPAMLRREACECSFCEAWRAYDKARAASDAAMDIAATDARGALRWAKENTDA